MKKFQFLLAGALAIGMLSCEKSIVENTDDISNNDAVVTVSDEDLAYKEAASEDLITTAEYEVDYFTGSEGALLDQPQFKSTDGYRFGHRYLKDKAPEVTIDSTDGGFPVTITLNYGDGTQLENGKMLSGKIVIVKSDKRLADSATRTVTFDGFYIDTVNVAGGYLSIFYRGQNKDQGVFEHSREITITFPDESYVERTGKHTRTWESGLSTHFLISDDVVLIDGAGDCNSSEGFSYTRTITKTLVKKGECKFIVEGTVEFNRNGKVMTLDYGNGECDNIATVTKDGESKEIKLGKWRRDNKNK